MTQAALEQDIELVVRAQAKVVNLLYVRPRYRVRDAQRILRAAKELELLAKELEPQDQ